MGLSRVDFSQPFIKQFFSQRRNDAGGKQKIEKHNLFTFFVNHLKNIDTKPMSLQTRDVYL
jgi:hypothetical protein